MPDEPRHAIITGAASGLGRALAVRLARDGWRMALADIDEAGLKQSAAAVAAAGGVAQIEMLDVGDPAAWQSLAERLRSQWPRLDLLVNNAGVCGAGSIGEFPLDDWEWLWRVNLCGPLYGCHTFVGWLKENPGRGRIVNIASIAGVLSPPTMGAYSVSKAAVIALSETLYGELRPYGVGVTVVCPGFFASKLVDCGRFSTRRSRRAAQQMTDDSVLSAERVAERVVRGMRRGKLYVVEGARARWYWRMKRWFPGGFHRLLSAAIHRWNRELDAEERRA